MRLKQLLAVLQEVTPFEEPDYTLEQYKTGAELASQIVWTLQHRFGAFEGRAVLDLGCGTGILGIGAAMLGAAHVVAVDIDPHALAQAAANADDLELGGVMSFLRADLVGGGGGGGAVPTGGGRAPLRGGAFDTVIMNPPFGTRRPGADVAFLRAGLAAVAPSGGCVYSLHKSSTRAHLVRAAASGALSPDGAPAGVELVAQLAFDIPATYDFHRADVLDVDVDLLRLVRGPSAAADALLAAVDRVPHYMPAAPGAVAAAAAAAEGGDGGRRAGGGGGGGRRGGGGALGGRKPHR